MTSIVSIAWFNSLRYNHVAISVDDKIYGFDFGGDKIQEPLSLDRVIQKIQGRIVKPTKAKSIVKQDIQVTGEQKNKILALCNRSVLPSFTCMHAVSQILSRVVAIKIPFPTCIMPEHSRRYLQKLSESSSFLLRKQKMYVRQGIDVKKEYDVLKRGEALRLVASVSLVSVVSAYLLFNNTGACAALGATALFAFWSNWKMNRDIKRAYCNEI